MRALGSLPLFIWTLLAVCVASKTLEDAFQEIPTCAVPCVKIALAESPCGSLANQTCICSSHELEDSVSACVIRACSPFQALQTRNITMEVCERPVRDRSDQYATIALTLGIISAVSAIMRLVYKACFTIAEFGLDDWFILVTLMSGMTSCVLNVVGLARYGIGRDVWTLTSVEVTTFVKYLYIAQILYFVEVALLKLSLLFFFQRIFPGRPVRRLILVTLIFNTLYGLVFVFVGIFQCWPIKYYWQSWDREHEGKCININGLGWANAAISIALDFWMLAIPLSQLLYLKLAWNKKLSVASMFCVGTFVTVVSILRLQSLVNFANSQNPTWDQYPVCLWSTVEINVGIMCACMPAIRVILVRLFPKIMGSSGRTTDQHAQYMKYGSKSNARPISKGLKPHNKDMGGILVSRDIEIEHGETDEIGLVHYARGGSTKSSAHIEKSTKNSSEISL